MIKVDPDGRRLHGSNAGCVHSNKGATLLKLPPPKEHLNPDRVQLRRAAEAIDRVLP